MQNDSKSSDLDPNHKGPQGPISLQMLSVGNTEELVVSWVVSWLVIQSI